MEAEISRAIREMNVGRAFRWMMPIVLAQARTVSDVVSLQALHAVANARSREPGNFHHSPDPREQHRWLEPGESQSGGSFENWREQPPGEQKSKKWRWGE